jgi:hypothetical protein
MITFTSIVFEDLDDDEEDTELLNLIKGLNSNFEEEYTELKTCIAVDTIKAYSEWEANKEWCEVFTRDGDSYLAKMSFEDFHKEVLLALTFFNSTS